MKPERIHRFDSAKSEPESPAVSPPVTATPLLADAALHGLAGEIVRMIAPHTEAHPAGLLVAFLVAFGSAVGRGAWMVASGTRHHANLFGCLVGKSSRARKGTAAGNVRDLFGRAGILPPTVSGLSTGEGIIHAIRDSRPETDDDGVADKRLFVLEGELGRALAAMKREGNTLSSVLREAWDGTALQTLTKREGERCAEPHVALLAGVTVEELKMRFNESERWNGLGNRVLWVLVERLQLLPEAGELPWGTLSPLLANLADAVAFARVAGELHRSDSGGVRWREIYAELAGAAHGGEVGCLCDRAEAQVLRLGMIFAMLDKSSTAEPAHLDAALAVWRYCEASVVSIFGGLSKVARDVLSALTGAKPGELDRDEISKKASGGHLYGERLDHALAELLKAKLAIGPRKDRTGGRPRELWRAA